MRVTTKGARTFFLLMLTVLAILGIYQCFTMANAFNLSPYTFKLRAKGVATDSVSIYGGSLHAEHVDSVIVVTLRAGDKVVTDTIQGAGSVVGIVDDTLRLDADSTGAYAIITFGGWGGGIRWNQGSDAMEFTNDFATWTTFGSGSGTGDIEGVTAGNGLSGGGTSGTPTLDVRPGWGLEINNDSVRVNASQVSTLVGSGGESDSNAIIYSTDRVQPYSDTGVYIGGTSDDMMMDFTRADTILAFVGVFYGEGVADSMLMSKGWIESIVGDSVAGKIDGINSSNGISGSASEGVANIQLDPSHFAVGGDTVKIFDNNSGRLVFNVFGTPSDVNELTINENITTVRGYLDVLNLDSWAMVHTNGSGYLDDISVGAAGTVFMGTGTSAAPAFYPLKTVIDTLSGVAIPVADSTNGGAIRAETVDTSNQHIAVKANIGDSIAAHWAAWVADANVSVRDSLHKYLDTNEALYSKIDTTTAKIPTATLADTTVGGAARAEVAKTVIVNSIDSTHIKPNSVLKSELAIESVDSTKLIASSVLSPEIADGSIALADYGANSIDSTKIMPSSIKASELAVNVVDSTHLTANSVLASEIATGAVATAEILDRTVAAIDIDTSATIKANKFNGNWLTAWPDSTLSLGSGGGLIIGSYIALGSEITDDTALITLPAEWAGAVLSRGYGIDSTKGWDSLDISGGSDIYGNYIEFSKTATTSGVPTAMRRNFQIAIPVPDDADTVYDVSLSYRVFNGTDNESSYVRLKWSTTPFDSAGFTNTYKPSYTDLDSSNSTTFDTLGTDYNRTYVTRGSKIYVLVTALLYDFHTTWARCYDVMVVYRRNRL